MAKDPSGDVGSDAKRAPAAFRFRYGCWLGVSPRSTSSRPASACGHCSLSQREVEAEGVRGGVRLGVRTLLPPPHGRPTPPLSVALDDFPVLSPTVLFACDSQDQLVGGMGWKTKALLKWCVGDCVVISILVSLSQTHCMLLTPPGHTAENKDTAVLTKTFEMASDPTAAIDRLHESLVDGRAENGRYRQDQLQSLHRTLREQAGQICAALQADSRSTAPEIEAEYYLTMQAVKHFYDSVDFEQDLKDEYSVAHGKDHASRRIGVGLVVLRPTSHTRFYAIVTPLAAAIAAGNCVVLEVSSL